MEPSQHTSSRCTASQVNESEQMMLGTESVCDLHRQGYDIKNTGRCQGQTHGGREKQSLYCTAEQYLWNMRGKQSMTILQSLLTGMTKSVDGY